MTDFISHAIVSAMAHANARPDVVIVGEMEAAIANVYHPHVMVVRTSHEGSILLNSLLAVGAKVGVSTRTEFVVYHTAGNRVEKWTLRRPDHVRF